MLRHRLRSVFGSGIDILNESITHRNKKRYAIVSDRERSNPFLLPQVRTSFQADQARNRRNVSLLAEQRLGSSRVMPDSDEEEEDIVDPNYEYQFNFETWLVPAWY